MNLIDFQPGLNDSEFFKLLNQLRPHLDMKTFLEIFQAAKDASNYEMKGLYEEGQLVALIGYRILSDFVHGRHLYIDDLVTSENVRSKGYGAILLKEAENIARENGCNNLRLCTGIDNEKGKSFYDRNDWKLRAVVYKKKLT